MFQRHHSTVSSTRRANQGRLRALRPSFGPQAQRNTLYAAIAQQSPQAKLSTLIRLVG